jgi:hypothetical protein
MEIVVAGLKVMLRKSIRMSEKTKKKSITNVWYPG